ncbi:MAG: STAS domain-containing protein [Phycisphaerae bacterium]|nr:STAS domain-containing protein [Phycisphaerae bacterium]
MDQKESVRIAQEGPVVVVGFAASSITDAQVIAAASTRIRGLLEAGAPSRVVFDFSGVGFFSSQVLGLLLETRARLRATGGKVVISSLAPALQRVFKITSLDRIFEFFPTRQAAMAAVGPTN